MVEDENKMSRKQKIMGITLLSASVALIASIYLTAENDDIFSGVTNRQELHKVWKEFNRSNHPDKCSLEGIALDEHMKEYHKTKDLYEKLLLKF